MASLYHIHLGIGELLDFASPLVFQRGRAEDKHGANESFLAEKFGCAYRLDSLAETHLVGNDSLASLGGKANALFLVRVEGDFQQFIEFLVIVCIDNLLSCRFLTNIHNKVNGILIASKRVAYLSGLFQERADMGIGGFLQDVVLIKVILGKMFVCFLVI